MKTIFLDSDFMCHLTDDGTRTEVQTDALDHLCDRAIELMRYVPEGRVWFNPRGFAVHGEFIQATDSSKIDSFQAQAQIEDMKAALALLGVTE